MLDAFCDFHPCSTLKGIMRQPVRLYACFAFVALSAAFLVPARAQTSALESRAVHAYQTATHNGSPALYAFLVQFPKGADLHVHLSGAVYAETFLREAGEDGLCVDPAALSFAKPPCAPPLVSAAQLTANQGLYDRLIDAFSMRGFIAAAGLSGHDHFFSTFDRYGGLSKKHLGEWVDEVASRADAQNQQYVELMETPTFSHAAQIAHENPLNLEFARYRETLLSHGLRDEVSADREEARTAEAQRREIEHCGTPPSRARLPGRSPLHLYDSPRLRARAGLCAVAAGL
jgi:adenosine deaminase